MHQAQAYNVRRRLRHHEASQARILAHLVRGRRNRHREVAMLVWPTSHSLFLGAQPHSLSLDLQLGGLMKAPKVSLLFLKMSTLLHAMRPVCLTTDLCTLIDNTGRQRLPSISTQSTNNSRMHSIRLTHKLQRNSTRHTVKHPSTPTLPYNIHNSNLRTTHRKCHPSRNSRISLSRAAHHHTLCLRQ